MKVLVCGGRDFDDWHLFCKGMYENGLTGLVLREITIIEGGARGADFLAKVWAKWVGVKLEEFPADWKTLGKSAGSVRNTQMLAEGKPDLVIAFPGGSGTANMIKQAKEAGVEVKEVK